MSDHKTPEELAASLLLVNYHSEISDKRAASFTMNVDRNCPQKELDDAMDKMRRAIERQKKFAIVDGVERDIARWKGELAGVEADILRLDQLASSKAKSGETAARKGEYFGMTKEQENKRREWVTDVDRLRSNILVNHSRLHSLCGELGDGLHLQQAAE